MTAAAIVTVRATSSRLPGKCLLPITGEYNALQVVLRRAAATGLPVVIATSTAATDDPIEAVGRAAGVAVFRGRLLNKLQRWRDCAQAHGLDHLIMVDGDDLAFDYDIAKRVAELMRGGEADAYKPPADIVCGLFTAAYTRAALDKLAAQAPDPEQDTDVIDVFTERARLRVAEVPLTEEERGKTVRLTLDYQEDAEFFRALYARLPVDAAGPEVVRVALDEGLWRLNWSRQADYVANQQAFNRKIETSA